MREHELRDKLKYGRITDPGNLSADDRQQLERCPQLSRELELNQALRRSRPVAPEAPAAGKLLDGAIASAVRTRGTGGERVTVRGRRFGHRLYWPAAAAILVAVIAGLACLPWRISLTPAGISLQRKSAWAATSGHVLEYTIEAATYYHGTVLDSPNHPLCRIEAMVADWARRNAGARTGDSQPLAELVVRHSMPIPNSGGMTQHWLSVNIYAPGQNLADDLATTLDSIAGLGEADIQPVEWFHSSRYPDRRFTGSTITINGRSHAYPRDINEFTWPPLLSVLPTAPENYGRIYAAVKQTAAARRYGLGCIVRAELDPAGNLNIENVPGELDFAGLGLPGWKDALLFHVPPTETHLELDAADTLKRFAAAHGNRSIVYQPSGKRIVVDLLPRDVRYSSIVDGLSGELSPENIDAARQAAADMGDALAEVMDMYPDARPRMSSETISIGAVPVQWTATIDIPGSAGILDSLERSLIAHGAGPVRTVPHLAPQKQHTTALPDDAKARLRIHLGPAKDADTLSPEQQTAATERTARLEAVFGDWLADNATAGNAPPRLEISRRGGWPDEATIHLYSRGNRLLDSLREELVNNDLRPFTYSWTRDDETGGPPVGMALACYFFAPQQFAGVHQSQVKQAFSAANFQRGEELSGRIRQALESYAVTAGTEYLAGGSVEQAFVNLPYNGLVTGTLIKTTLPPGEALASLQAALALPGIPAQIITAPPDYNIEVPFSGRAAHIQAANDARRDTVLLCSLSYEERCVACPEQSLELAFTDSERQASHEMLSRMQARLDGWLAGPGAGLSAWLAPALAGGTVVRIAVNCSDHSASTAQSLQDALYDPDPPTTFYLETVAPFYREPAPIPPLPGIDPADQRPVYTTTVQWNLLPLIRLALLENIDDEAALRDEFSAEELAGTLRQAAAIRKAYDTWLEQHPGLLAPLQGASGERPRCELKVSPANAQYVKHVSVMIRSEDESDARRLAGELKEMVKAAGNVETHGGISSRPSML